jgi:hypothetical protein
MKSLVRRATLVLAHICYLSSIVVRIGDRQRTPVDL